MEIERKWLVSNFPSSIYKPVRELNINQGYLYTNPEVRIRRTYDVKTYAGNYYLDIKTDGNLSREEVVLDITSEDYDKIKEIINKTMIQKTYKVYQFAGYNVEISMVDTNWFYAEVEFESEKDAKAFTFPFPDILIKEVTDDPEYKLKNWWIKRDELGYNLRAKKE